MARARRATRRRKSSGGKKKASGAALDAKVKKALATLKDDFEVAKIVGSAKRGKLELKTDTEVEIRFISLNAPFKTKALISAS
jgi:hypothetical protein